MKLFRLLLVLIIPLFLVLIIYSKLSPAVCFSPTKATTDEVEKFISSNLITEFKRIQTFAPIIQFGNDWFRYNVSLENKFKVSFVASKLNIYSEATTTLILTTQNGTSTIPYNSNVQIADGISIGEIPNLITGLIFTIGPKETLIFPPNTAGEIQTNTSWPLCLYITLQKNYKPLIWFVCLVFLVGLLTLGRQIVTFIYKDPYQYFKSE